MNKSRLSLVFYRLLFGLVFAGGMGFFGLTTTINAPAIAQTSVDSDAQNPFIPEKFAQLLKKAEGGDVSAQSRIALIYYSGIGIDTDFQKARYWFEAAAEQGHINALYMLSRIHLNGLGVEEDARMAANYLKQASDKGDAPAQALLAGLYAEGRGVKQNYIIAKGLFSYVPLV